MTTVNRREFDDEAFERSDTEWVLLEDHLQAIEDLKNETCNWNIQADYYFKTECKSEIAKNDRLL